MSLVDAAAVVFGSPIVLGGPHPKVAYAALLANALRPKAKFISVIGSYGWGGRLAESLQSMLTSLKAEFIPPVLAKGLPRPKDYAALDALAETIQSTDRTNTTGGSHQKRSDKICVPGLPVMSMIRPKEIPQAESPRELHSKRFPITGSARFAGFRRA